MKKILVASIATLVLTIPASAGAVTITWPAQCKGWTCVNRHLNALHNRDLAKRARIADLTNQLRVLTNRVGGTEGRLGCIGSIPFAVYRLPGAYDRDDIFRNRGDSVAGQYTAQPRFFGPNWDPWNGNDTNLSFLYDACGGRFP